jgi:hypothetical protein
MLADNEIALFKSDERYQKILLSGIKNIGSDIIRSGDGEFRTDITFFLKALYIFMRSRFITKELTSCTDVLLCKLLDHELNWIREPEEVKNICEMADHGYIWMRYDVPRVNSLFLWCQRLLTNPEYRNLVKQYSTINGDKNGRLGQLTLELDQLKKNTIRSIRTKGVFDDLIDLQKDEFYERYRNEIQSKFLDPTNNGVLSLPSKDTKSDDDGE